MGNSPSATAPAAPAPAATVAANSATNKKNANGKTVIQVPAENVTVTKGGKCRRLRGGMASVHFDLPPLVDPDHPDHNGGQRKGHKRRTRRARK